MIWPEIIAPFKYHLINLNKSSVQTDKMYKSLQNRGIEVLYDDRNESAGVKFNDAYLIGNPYVVIMGKKYLNEGKIDLEVRKTHHKKSFNKDELINFLKGEYAKKGY